MNQRLRSGMSVNEVVAAFGEPSTGVPQLPGASHIRYIAPIGSMTVPKEGYIGFEIELVNGRVKSWRTFRGNPSYAAMTAPPEFKWFGTVVKIVLIVGAAYGVILGIGRRHSETRDLLAAYANRDIPTRELPVEFRFMTHDTTIQELLEKAGPCSQQRKFPIDPRVATGGYTYTDDSSPGRPAIVILEYELPFHGAVMVIPDCPFEADSRIRAVFYRAPRPEEP